MPSCAGAAESQRRRATAARDPSSNGWPPLPRRSVESGGGSRTWPHPPGRAATGRRQARADRRREAPASPTGALFPAAPERHNGRAGARVGRGSPTSYWPSLVAGRQPLPQRKPIAGNLARDRRPNAVGKSSTDADRRCRYGSQQRRSEKAQTQARVARHVACPPEAPLDGSAEATLDWRYALVKHLSTIHVAPRRTGRRDLGISHP